MEPVPFYFLTAETLTEPGDTRLPSRAVDHTDPPVAALRRALSLANALYAAAWTLGEDLGLPCSELPAEVVERFADRLGTVAVELSEDFPELVPDPAALAAGRARPLPFLGGSAALEEPSPN